MAELTQREVCELKSLLEVESVYFRKFEQYGAEAQEAAVQKLCRHLADRTRQHFRALIEAAGESGGSQLH